MSMPDDRRVQMRAPLAPRSSLGAGTASDRRLTWSASVRRVAAVVIVLAAVAGSFAAAQGMQVPDGFVIEPVITGLSGTTDAAFTSDGRMFISEIGGVVRVVDGGALLPTPFIDLRDRVNWYGDRGLVSVAVHPRFPSIPYVYLAFAYDPPELALRTGEAGPNGGGSRVSRVIRVSADASRDYLVARHDTEAVLLGRNSTIEHMGDPALRNPDTPSCGLPGAYVQDCLPADEHSHTVGRLRFGPDEVLYVASGDGADYHAMTANHVRALDIDSLAGKLLRINPITGDGLPDNPFWDGDPRSNRSKVLNYGLRNPYSFTFHPESGVPVMGDVGWATWEMINVGTGENFGWPCYEGGDGENRELRLVETEAVCETLYADDGAGVTPPVYAYNREGTGGAIIVGEFYDGDAFPEAYHGRLLIADYYQHWIRTVTMDSEGTVTAVEPFASVRFPVHVSVGSDGAVYYLNIWEGTLFRIRYEGGGS